MANYTAADVKKLRELTGAGMMDCKKALDEADVMVVFMRRQKLKGEQLERFRAFVEELRPAHEGLLVHAANSAATLRDPAAHFDLVRCGIAVYGMDPFHEDPSARDLEPALKFVLDQLEDVTSAYRLRGMPTNVFIDRDGTVREVYSRALGLGEMRDAVRQLVSESAEPDFHLPDDVSSG